ncbi:glycoside hydrolase family 28 protein [Sphingomonas sp. BIUV-7]|uniref:Glycoside hydrolase family 28 protein n=1 Tax=Sphingomonas natans TaxID=3063330 RepID=A0ABT8Y5E5_9SPHN|nr:glycoside hydrolase family 28 protein [Sphingomonas sp. BIUV-7]MDO6413552.1 glycoside hydrolase family 28 protein [Sphingomonas sp. BIUV-7]
MTGMFDRRTFLAASAVLATGLQARSPAGDGWERAAEIVARVRPPRFPRRAFDVRKFGAASGGATLCTQAFADAIAACAAAGGGRVIVPEGRWLTGAIRLQSNVELHLAKGATIAFATDPALYPIVPTRFEGVELMGYSPLIYASDAQNVAVTGYGTIDGQGEAWWSWSGGSHYGWREGLPNQRAARTRLFAMAEAGIPVSERRFGEGSYLRPNLIQFQRCDTVMIEGVTLRDSPCWNVHPVLSRNVTLRGVTVIGLGPNNDGCDPESVDGMLIEDCTFDTGDDCIAIKSGRNADGRRLNAPARNIVIRHCTMKAGHGGVVIGSEVSGGVENVFAEHCAMSSPDLWYALRFKTNAVRGGRIAHVRARDIIVGQVGRAALTCDFNYEEGANGAFKPELDDIVVERLRVANAIRVLDCQGLPQAPIGRLTLRDCRFDGVHQPSIVERITDLGLEGVKVNGRKVATL